jgi:hypothetical protein
MGYAQPWYARVDYHGWLLPPEKHEPVKFMQWECIFEMVLAYAHHRNAIAPSNNIQNFFLHFWPLPIQQ